MTGTTIRFMRVNREGKLPIVFQNLGDLDLVIFDEKEFIRYACAGHLEPYGFVDVDAADIIDDVTRMNFYTDSEKETAMERLSRLLKFSHIIAPHDAIKLQAIGSFNYLWNIVTREENCFD